MNQNQFALALLAGACGLSSVAQAHYGQRIWVDVSPAGKIITETGPAGDAIGYTYKATDFTPGRVFTRDMGGLGDLNDGIDDAGNDSDGVNYATEFPGFEQTKFPSTSFSGVINEQFAGEVLFYNAAQQRFDPVSQAFAGQAIPFFSVSDGVTTGNSPTGSAIVPAGRALTVGSHFHPERVLQYAGGPSDGVDAYSGVYALPMQLTGNGLTTSDTFYLLLGKNASLETLQAADTVAKQTLVPEPAMLGSMALAGLLLRRRVRSD